VGIEGPDLFSKPLSVKAWALFEIGIPVSAGVDHGRTNGVEHAEPTEAASTVPEPVKESAITGDAPEEPELDSRGAQECRADLIKFRRLDVRMEDGIPERGIPIGHGPHGTHADSPETILHQHHGDDGTRTAFVLEYVDPEPRIPGLWIDRAEV